MYFDGALKQVLLFCRRDMQVHGDWQADADDDDLLVLVTIMKMIVIGNFFHGNLIVPFFHVGTQTQGHNMLNRQHEPVSQ